MNRSAKRLRLGIVGSGNMARVHANHWLKVPEVDLVAVASHDFESARLLTGAGEAAFFPTLSDLLAAVEVDIVDVCAPTPAHLALGLECLAAGKHMLLEKPMGRTVAECDQLIAAAEQSPQSIVMVGHVLRYFPEYALAKRQVDAGAVGTPAAVRTARLAAHPKGGWHNWYADPALSGGVALDMVIHDFDWLRWTFGPVDRVFAKGLFGAPEQVGKLDYCLCTLRHSSGVLAHVTGSWAHTGGFRTQFEICGSAGMIEHDSQSIVPLTVSQRESGVSGTPGVAVPESPMSARDDPYYCEIRHFADCVLAGTPPDITLDDARAAVAIAEAALESIASGQPVAIH